MMRAPRCEGDQEVTILELNQNDAAKGSGNVPLLAFLGMYPLALARYSWEYFIRHELKELDHADR